MDEHIAAERHRGRRSPCNVYTVYLDCQYDRDHCAGNGPFAKLSYCMLGKYHSRLFDTREEMESGYCYQKGVRS